MATANVYPDTVETHLYWNLLKDLSESVRIQLYVKLKDSLSVRKNPSVDGDAQAAYFTILDKLKTYQNYPKGWDGEDASPLTQKTIANFCQFLEKTDKQLLQYITIYPEINGTLLIESTRRDAGICLGDKSFSYYEMDGDSITGENAIPFSVSALTDIIKKISG